MRRTYIVTIERAGPKVCTLNAPVVVSNTRIDLTGTPPQNDGAGLKDFTLQYSLDGSTNWTNVSIAPSMSWSHTGLTPGVQYWYRAFARDNLNQAGPFSAIVTASAGPTAPTISAAASSSGSALINLVTPSSDVGATVVSYKVLVNTVGAAGAFSLIATITQAEFPYTATGLTPSTTYYFAVQSVDSGAITSSLSNVAQITTLAGSSVAAPRLGIISTSSPNTAYSAVNGTRMSKFHFSIFGIDYEGGGSQAYGGSAGAFIDYVHAQSTLTPKAKVFKYYIPDTVKYIASPPVTAVNPNQVAYLNANNWFLYQTGTSGTKAPNYDSNTAHLMANMTTYVPSDGSGLKVADRSAKYQLDVIAGTYNAVDACPNLDGFFQDAFCQRTPTGGSTSANPSFLADFNRNGVSDYQSIVGPPSGAQIDVELRLGMKRGPDYIHANSSKLCVANIDGWNDPTATFTPTNKIGALGVTEFNQVLDGGLIESHKGISYSLMARQGFATAKAQYQFCLSQMTGIKMCVVNCPTKANGSDFSTATPYQAARASFCYVHQDDGYFCSGLLNAGGTGYSGLVSDANWYDEYAVNPLTMTATGEAGASSGQGYLGVPIDAAWTLIGSGVYGRRYFHAGTGYTWVVVYNPLGNGSQTINFVTVYGKSLAKFTGTQAPTINNGATVSSVTFAADDGIVGRLV